MKGNDWSTANGKFLESCSKSFNYHCYVICLGPVRSMHWLIINKFYSNLFIIKYKTPQILQSWNTPCAPTKADCISLTDQSDGNCSPRTSCNLLSSAEHILQYNVKPSIWGLFENKVNKQRNEKPQNKVNTGVNQI